jgi:hypothetical protein
VVEMLQAAKSQIKWFLAEQKEVCLFKILPWKKMSLLSMKTLSCSQCDQITSLVNILRACIAHSKNNYDFLSGWIRAFVFWHTILNLWNLIFHFISKNLKDVISLFTTLRNINVVILFWYFKWFFYFSYQFFFSISSFHIAIIGNRAW